MNLLPVHTLYIHTLPCWLECSIDEKTQRKEAAAYSHVVSVDRRMASVSTQSLLSPAELALIPGHTTGRRSQSGACAAPTLPRLFAAAAATRSHSGSHRGFTRATRTRALNLAPNDDRCAGRSLAFSSFPKRLCRRLTARRYAPERSRARTRCPTPLSLCVPAEQKLTLQLSNAHANGLCSGREQRARTHAHRQPHTLQRRNPEFSQ